MCFFRFSSFLRRPQRYAHAASVNAVALSPFASSRSRVFVAFFSSLFPTLASWTLPRLACPRRNTACAPSQPVARCLSPSSRSQRSGPPRLASFPPPLPFSLLKDDVEFKRKQREEQKKLKEAKDKLLAGKGKKK